MLVTSIFSFSIIFSKSFFFMVVKSLDCMVKCWSEQNKREIIICWCINFPGRVLSLLSSIKSYVNMVISEGPDIFNNFWVIMQFFKSTQGRDDVWSPWSWQPKCLESWLGAYWLILDHDTKCLASILRSHIECVSKLWTCQSEDRKIL